MTHLSRVSTVRRALLASAAAWPLAAAFARDDRHGLERDEGLIVMPSTARLVGGDRVAVRIEGWVYERESRRVATHVLARALGLDLDTLSTDESALFRARAQLFGREAQGGRVLRARVDAGSAWTLLAPSTPTGRLDAALSLPSLGLEAAADAIGFELDGGRGRRLHGRARLHAREGLSVVSDIDDTIKHTQILDRRAMLLNTFARPFVAAPGMRDWYARIAAADAGAAFHYVSSGPWPLAPALEGFLDGERFPAGSLHLRAFSLSPRSLLAKGASSTHKQTTISRLLADFPQRRFVLVGDSGERDPEIYGGLARAHPTQVAAVLIRDVTGEAPIHDRYRHAFAGMPRSRWQLFDDPASLPASWT